LKAIVTGGAGFIGSQLAKRLLKEGWKVFIFDNLSSGYFHNIPKGAVFKWLDLRDQDAFTLLPKEQIDVVFHLASHVGQELSFENPVFDLEVNAMTTMKLLKWSLEKKVKQFIFTSSMNIYGNATEFPVIEDTKVQPPSPYAVGKIASEYLCQIYQGLGVNTTSLRLFNVYGPGQDLQNMKQGMVSIYLAYLLKKEPILVRGSQERFRDFVFVEDVVDAFYRCVDERAYGRVYNVATGRKTYVKELLKMLASEFTSAPDAYPIIFDEPTLCDQFGIYGDASRLQKELGWKPSVSLEEGIRHMVCWAKSMLREKEYV